jgi:hypothetical protein
MQTTPGLDVVELFRFFKKLWRIKAAFSRPAPGSPQTAMSADPDLPRKPPADQKDH